MEFVVFAIPLLVKLIPIWRKEMLNISFMIKIFLAQPRENSIKTIITRERFKHIRTSSLKIRSDRAPSYKMRCGGGSEATAEKTSRPK